MLAGEFNSIDNLHTLADLCHNYISLNSLNFSLLNKIKCITKCHKSSLLELNYFYKSRIIYITEDWQYKRVFL